MKAKRIRELFVVVANGRSEAAEAKVKLVEILGTDERHLTQFETMWGDLTLVGELDDIEYACAIRGDVFYAVAKQLFQLLKETGEQR